MSLEDPLYIYNSRQLEIRKDLSADEYLAFDKNLHFMDATDMQNQMSADFVIESIKELFEKKPESAPLRLVIIDHLSYWSNQDLNDGGQCTNIVKDLYQIADSLNCAVLVLHHTNRNALIKGKDRQTGSVNIGGSYKLHSLTRWVAVLEHVEKSELKKVHKIEGNEEDYKVLLLDKVNHGEKLKILLKKRPDRLGLLYGVGFGEKKPETKKESVQEEIVSKEEIEKFNMVSTSIALSSLDDNTHHIMTWLAQNPAFETVSLQRRNALTEVVGGEKRDLNRDKVSVYMGVWNTDTTLFVDGPVCDQEDMKLYALLVKELGKHHGKGHAGIFLDVSLKELQRLLGLTEGGSGIKVILRQLDRLGRMHLKFKNRGGSLWAGPLLTKIAKNEYGKESKLRIEFNSDMITFYKAQEYTKLNSKIFWSLPGDSALLFAFYASNEKKEQRIPFSKIQEILSIATDTPKKATTRRITKAYQKLLEVGIFDPSRSKIEKDSVHTVMI